MTDRPILFKAPLVRAILDGRKTQTRRAIKLNKDGFYTLYNAEGERCGGATSLDGLKGYTGKFRPHIIGEGDRLWIREAVRAEELETGLAGVRYLADDHFEPIENTKEAGEQWVQLNGYRHGDGLVVPPIHAPRWTSRIDLLVTGVRAERLQDISEPDAKAEGISTCTKDGKLWKYGKPDSDGLPGTDNDGWPWADWCKTPREAFAKLWDEINPPPYSWSDNPFVWVIEFERIKP